MKSWSIPVVLVCAFTISGCQTTKERAAVEERFFVNPTVSQQQHLDDKQACAEERDSDAAAEGANLAVGFLAGGLVGMMIMADANEDTDAATYYACLAARGYQPILVPDGMGWMVQGNTDVVMRGEAVEAYFQQSSEEERVAWNAAAAKGSTSSYREFLDAYPTGFHAREASERITSIAIAMAESSPSSPAVTPTQDTTTVEAPATAEPAKQPDTITPEATATAPPEAPSAPAPSVAPSAAEPETAAPDLVAETVGTTTPSSAETAAPAPRLASLTAPAPPPAPPPAPSTVPTVTSLVGHDGMVWVGSARSDGTSSSSYTGAFCDTNDPSRMRLTVEGHEFSGTITNTLNGQVGKLSGRIAGGEISGRYYPTAGHHSRVLRGRLSNGELSGVLTDANAWACSGRFVLTPSPLNEPAPSVTPVSLRAPANAETALDSGDAENTEPASPEKSTTGPVIWQGHTTGKFNERSPVCSETDQFTMNLVLSDEAVSGQLMTTSRTIGSHLLKGSISDERIEAVSASNDGDAHVAVLAGKAGDILKAVVTYQSTEGSCMVVFDMRRPVSGT